MSGAEVQRRFMIFVGFVENHLAGALVDQRLKFVAHRLWRIG